MIYKINRTIVFAILIAGIATSFHFITLSKKEIKRVPGSGFAVLELFTSEGCSSCPPTDALLAKLSAEYAGKVFVLGFHVDYWNRLGWKDQFSSEAYSNRQGQYGKQFRLNSIYTPQVVVNGKTEMVGSNESKLRSSIVNELKNTSASTGIIIKAKGTTNNAINVSYQLNKTSNAILNIALVQQHAQSNVKRGENEGKILTHVNVVRDFKTISIAKTATGNTSFTLPQGLSAKDCKVISFLQHADNLEVTAATETIIE